MATATPGTFPSFPQYQPGALPYSGGEIFLLVSSSTAAASATYQDFIVNAVGKTPGALTSANPTSGDLITFLQQASGLPKSCSIANLAVPYGNVPTGGSTFQIFAKNSGTNFDATWYNITNFIGVGTGLATSGTGTSLVIAVSGAISTFAGLANPAATVGLSPANGVASTAMRSDGAPALSQSISPTWTATHTFSGTTSLAGFTLVNNTAFGGIATSTASIGLSLTTGVATTAMRSDTVLALSQAISPTWTRQHVFSGSQAAIFNSTSAAVAYFGNNSQSIPTASEDFAISGNFSNGFAEIDLWNTNLPGTYSNTGFRFLQLTNATQTRDLMFLHNGGNVAIGTTNATNKLDVVGGVAIGVYAGATVAPTNGLIVSGNVGIGTTATVTSALSAVNNSPLGQAFNFSQNLVGTSGGPYNLNQIAITESVDGGSSFVNGMAIIHNVNGGRGGRETLAIVTNVSSTPPISANPFIVSLNPTLTGMVPSGGTAGGAFGDLVCFNPVAIMNGSATFWAEVCTQEADVLVETGASVKYVTGVKIVALAGHTVHGAISEGALVFGNQPGAVGWNNLIMVGAYSGGINPINATGTLLNTIGNPAFGSGIDLSGAVIATSAFKSSGFNVSGTGNVSIDSASAIPAGGTTGLGINISSAADFGLFFGTGAPTLSAGTGSIYLRNDGSSATTRLYVNVNGTTTWTSIVASG